jgi:hypothetical protein
MWTPVKNDYGYGWRIKQVRNQKQIAHGGGSMASPRSSPGTRMTMRSSLFFEQRAGERGRDCERFDERVVW